MECVVEDNNTAPKKYSDILSEMWHHMSCMEDGFSMFWDRSKDSCLKSSMVHIYTHKNQKIHFPRVNALAIRRILYILVGEDSFQILFIKRDYN